MLIAVDGGGTKTEALLCRNDGMVLSRLLGAASNPNSAGLDSALAVVRGLVGTLLQQANDAAFSTQGAAFFGLAGAGKDAARIPFERMLREMLPQSMSLCVGSDAQSCLSSGIGAQDGVVVICGTGSAAFARVSGALFQVGGWGHLIDDAGSGYDIARKAFRAVLRAKDGRGQQTALTAALEDRLGADVSDCIPELYRSGKRFIADFAPLVLSTHDPVADEIVEQAISDLVGMITAAARHLPAGEPCPVVLAGSIWKNERLREGVWTRLPERFRMIVPKRPPVYGSLVLAAMHAGLAVNGNFETAFDQSYMPVV